MVKLTLVPNTNMKILDVHWYNGTNCIGIVLVEDMTLNYTKAYIGVGKGFDEQVDAEDIAKWGSKIPKNLAEVIFGPQPDWSE